MNPAGGCLSLIIPLLFLGARWFIFTNHTYTDVFHVQPEVLNHLLYSFNSKCAGAINTQLNWLGGYHLDLTRPESGRISLFFLVAGLLALIQTKVPEVYHTQINDILLTALLQTFVTWTGHPSLLLKLESHGREEIMADLDFSRTVGWFTAHYPVHLQVKDARDIRSTLLAIKEQLRAVPQYGLGYGVLRYLAAAEVATSFRNLPTAEVSFNYLGQFDQTLDASSFFGSSYEATGLDRDPHNVRPFLLNINAQIVEGKLLIYWSYSEHRHYRETIEGLAQGFIESLHTIITHCQSSHGQGGYTPSDFPMAGLNQEELDSLFEELDGRQFS